MGGEPNLPPKKTCFCARKLTESASSLKLFFIDEIIIYIYIYIIALLFTHVFGYFVVLQIECVLAV